MPHLSSKFVSCLTTYSSSSFHHYIIAFASATDTMTATIQFFQQNPIKLTNLSILIILAPLSNLKFH